MPGFLVANALRPLFFVLSIVAAVIVGNRSNSFWVGLLAFLVAMGCARVIRRLIRGRTIGAARAAIWPALAVFFAWLFIDPLNLSKWIAVIVAFICAGFLKQAVANALLPRSSWFGWSIEEWGIPGRGDVVSGRWSRRDDLF
jgi:hypothetical protein